MSVKLRCGCEIKEDGSFELGQGCKERNCTECQTISELHPFGIKRFKVNIG